MPGNFPSSGDILECLIVSTANAQMGLNVIHFRTVTVVGTGVSLQEIAIRIDTNLSATYRNALSTSATYRGVGVMNITLPRTTLFTGTAGAGFGTGGSGLAPTQVRGLISWYASLAGPRYRGRTYIPFPSLGSVNSDGNPLASYVTAIDAIRALLLAPFTVTVGANSTSFELAIVHRGDVPITANPVVTSVARTRFATQRSSGSYGRANVPPF